MCVCARTHAHEPTYTCAQSCLTLWDPMDCNCLDPLSMEFSRQEYWSGCYFLLQRISRTQGLNLHLLRLRHWQVNYLPLCHLGSPITITNCLNCTKSFKSSPVDPFAEALPPLPSSQPSRSSQSLRLGFLCHTAASHQLPLLHMVLYKC